METDEEIKARQVIATTELRLALETEEERRAIKEWILFGFNLGFI